MKAAHLLTLAIIILCSCSSKNEYIIHGTFKGEPVEEWIYLRKIDMQRWSIDSAKIVDGTFKFSGTIDLPDVYAIRYNLKQSGELPIFIEPGKIDLVIDSADVFYGTDIQGGKYNDEYKAFKILTNKDKRIEVNWDSENPDEILEINARGWKRQKEYDKQSLEYINNNPHSPISIYLLLHKFTGLPLDEQGRLLTKFTPSVYHMSLYKYYKASYENQVKLLDNTPAYSLDSNGLREIEIDFSKTTILKTLIAHNPNKAMYIDVWATWCGPCIASFPNMKTLQEKYGEDGIIFVYLCAKSFEEDWIKMVKEENLIGQHYLLGDSILDRLNGEAKIIGFPKYMLINKEGKVCLKVPKPHSENIEKILLALAN